MARQLVLVSVTLRRRCLCAKMRCLLSGWHNEIPTFDLLTTTGRGRKRNEDERPPAQPAPLVVVTAAEAASQRRLRHVLSPETMATFSPIMSSRRPNSQPAHLKVVRNRTSIQAFEYNASLI